MHRLPIQLLAALGLILVNPSYADAIQREGPSPAEQAKITGALAKAYALQGGPKDQINITRGMLGDSAGLGKHPAAVVKIGGMFNNHGRQEETIVTRDVINLCMNCR